MGSDYSILIVDDNNLQRIFLKKIISKNTKIKTIDIAVDGIDALKKLQTNDHYDFIITDLHMPNMNGLELIKEIQNDIRLKEIPLYIISADSENELIVECLMSGAKEYFIKPMDIKAIMPILSKEIGEDLALKQ